MVYVTHDQVEAMTMGYVIVVMRDGKIQQHGPPLEVFNRPANVFVASFIGAPPMNMLSGTLGSHEDRLVFRAGPNSVPLPPAMGRALGHAAGREVVLGIRPQDLAIQRSLEQHSTGLDGEIVLVERLGTETHVDVDIGGLSVQASLPPTADLTEGPPVAPDQCIGGRRRRRTGLMRIALGTVPSASFSVPLADRANCPLSLWPRVRVGSGPDGLPRENSIIGIITSFMNH